ncbi:3-oxo-tetronate kinase [Budvicia aquatica]|uniref:3-oxo-tetronate kinase n=1 Tax=Budvicia aquatica TaxID=82979 RepID=UPI00208583EE|nr:3-oxo-tetronate kinase [Budvicia aquatica]GKX50750.1 hypothetical protein SOASR029_10590 [Budvicia aquatica]
MTIKLGVIADDFTGSTDIGCFLSSDGWQVIQFVGTPEAPLTECHADALIISLKSRSCPVQQAIEESLLACRWLKAAGCQQIYFKYCSTFDSTSEGNIGPVTDALLNELGSDFTLICPALPVNGRMVVHGHLFVNGRLLNESGMQNHPITPMKDANLMRLMDSQANGKTGLIDLEILHQGPQAIEQKIIDLRQQGYRYAVTDALTFDDLRCLKPVISKFPLLTGGSGLAKVMAEYADTSDARAHTPAYPNRNAPAVVLSGSCSVMTNQQVARYQQIAPSYALDAERCLNDKNYHLLLADWVLQQSSEWAPLVYATQEPEKVREIQQTYGVQQIGLAIERTFAGLAKHLAENGFNRFIIAGGETSSLIVQELGINKLEIGGLIAPGVPWVRDGDRPERWLALKSGNFGHIDFFQYAQELCHD